MARGKRKAHNRKEGIKRQPDGRPTQNAGVRKTFSNKEREEAEARIVETAMAVRIRAGVSPSLARVIGTPEAFLYDAWQKGRDGLSRDQYEAACWYQECRLRAYSATDNPHAPSEPREPSTGTGDPDAHARFCKAWVARWQAIRSAVQDTQTQLGNTANLFGALNSLEQGSIPEHQLGDLRYALNAVHKVRIGEKKRAA